MSSHTIFELIGYAGSIRVLVTNLVIVCFVDDEPAGMARVLGES